MGAVQDRLSLVAGAAPGSLDELEGVKRYLRIEHTADDALLPDLIESVKGQADGYLNNTFQVIALDGSIAEVPIPAAVRLWCQRALARAYENRVGAISSSVSGLESITWGELDYGPLAPYRRSPGL